MARREAALRLGSQDPCETSRLQAKWRGEGCHGLGVALEEGGQVG